MDKKRNQQIITVVMFLLAVIMTMYVAGFLPGMLGSSIIGRVSSLGNIECGASSVFKFLDSRCDFTGYEYGGILFLGYPVWLLGALIKSVTGLESSTVLYLLAFLMYCLSLLGFIRLSISIKINRYIALVLGYVYMNLPSIGSMQEFSGTYWGMILLPFFVYIATICILSFYRLSPFNYFINKKYNKENLFRYITSFFMCIALLVCSIFIDGYSFFMLVSVCMGLIFFLVIFPEKKAFFSQRYIFSIIGLLAFFIALGVAVVVFRQLVPSGSPRSDIGLFRSMGVDIATLFWPSSSFWWVKFFGMSNNHPNLWGDGSNVYFNYLGLTTIMTSIVGAWFGLKKYSIKNKRIYLLIILIMLSSFALSLGPSLKFNSIKQRHSGLITYNDYLMPSDKAIVKLPTSVLYSRIPGLYSMRATYRWIVLTQLCLLLLSGFALTTLFRDKNYRIISLSILAILLLEMSPNFIDVGKQRTAKYDQLELFNKQVLAPLDEKIKEGQTVLYYPNSPGSNDYLVNYISPYTKTFSYNVGGDKARDIVIDRMPKNISALLEDEDYNRPIDSNELFNAIKNNGIDVLVIPNFDLRWDAYSWPATDQAAMKRFKWAKSAVSKDSRFTVVNSTDYFEIVKINN